MPTAGATVAERILKHMVDAVAAIRKADGYNFDVLEMHDVQFNAFFAKRLPAAGVVALDEDAIAEGLIGRENRRMNVQVDVWLLETAPGHLKADLERIVADVYVALTADPQRGGLAVDTRYKSLLRVESEANDRQAGASMIYEVDYRYLAGDPTRVG